MYKALTPLLVACTFLNDKVVDNIEQNYRDMDVMLQQIYIYCNGIEQPNSMKHFQENQNDYRRILHLHDTITVLLLCV